MVVRVFCLFVCLFLCLGWKGYLDVSNFCHCYGNLFECAILLDYNDVRSSLSIIMMHIDNSVLKDTLQLKVLQKLIKIGANSFIKTWVNIIKRKSKKVPLKLSLAKKYDPAFYRTLHQNRYFPYCYTLLFLSNRPSF